MDIFLRLAILSISSVGSLLGNRFSVCNHLLNAMSRFQCLLISLKMPHQHCQLLHRPKELPQVIRELLDVILHVAFFWVLNLALRPAKSSWVVVKIKQKDPLLPLLTRSIL